MFIIIFRAFLALAICCLLYSSIRYYQCGLGFSLHIHLLCLDSDCEGKKGEGKIGRRKGGEGGDSGLHFSSKSFEQWSNLVYNKRITNGGQKKRFFMEKSVPR